MEKKYQPKEMKNSTARMTKIRLRGFIGRFPAAKTCYRGRHNSRLRHRHMSEHAMRKRRTVSPVREERGAKELDHGFAAQTQRFVVERIERKRKLHHWGAEEVEDIRAED